MYTSWRVHLHVKMSAPPPMSKKLSTNPWNTRQLNVMNFFVQQKFPAPQVLLGFLQWSKLPHWIFWWWGLGWLWFCWICVSQRDGRCTPSAECWRRGSSRRQWGERPAPWRCLCQGMEQRAFGSGLGGEAAHGGSVRGGLNNLFLQDRILCSGISLSPANNICSYEILQWKSMLHS